MAFLEKLNFNSIIKVTLNVQQSLSVEKPQGADSRSEIRAAGTFGDSGAWSPPTFVRKINPIPIKGADYPHYIGLFPQTALEMVTKITFCGKREIINDCRSEVRAAGKYRDLGPKQLLSDTVHARHYKLRLVYFLPHFSVQFIIKSG